MCRAALFTAWGFVLAGGVVLDPQSASAQPLAEARRALAAGEAAAAVPPLVESFAADPESPEGRDVLWNLARRATAYPDVVEAVFQRAGDLGSDGWIAAGVLLRRGFRPLDALEAFDRGARTRPPGDSLADVEAGWLLMELHADERALARFERHPTDPRAAYARAVILGPVQPFSTKPARSRTRSCAAIRRIRRRSCSGPNSSTVAAGGARRWRCFAGWWMQPAPTDRRRCGWPGSW